MKRHICFGASLPGPVLRSEAQLRRAAMVFAIVVFSGFAWGDDAVPDKVRSQEQLLKRIGELEERIALLERALEREAENLTPNIPFAPRHDDFDEFMDEFRGLMERFRSRPRSKMPASQPAGAYLGIEFRDLTPQEARSLRLKWGEGVVVKKVLADSPASKANLMEGDVIVEVNGDKVRDTWQFVSVVRSSRPGDLLKMVVLRNGKRHEVSATLASPDEMPDDYLQSPFTLPQFGQTFPWSGRFGMQVPRTLPREEIPPVEIKVQNETGEAVLTVTTSALAFTDELRTMLKATEKEAAALEHALAEARSELARRLTPLVSSSMETGAGMRFDASGIQAILDEVLKQVEEKLKAALPDDKLQTWRDYIQSHKYVSQSFSIKRGFGGAPPSRLPSAPAPSGNVRTF